MAKGGKNLTKVYLPSAFLIRSLQFSVDTRIWCCCIENAQKIHKEDNSSSLQNVSCQACQPEPYQPSLLVLGVQMALASASKLHQTTRETFALAR